MEYQFHGSLHERYFEKKKHPYTFGLDYDVCITKSLDWKKNNKESFYELRKCYFDIEIYDSSNLSYSYLHLKDSIEYHNIITISNNSKYGNLFSISVTNSL